MNYVDSLRKKIDSIFTATQKTRDDMRRFRRLFEGDLWVLSEPEFDAFEKSNIQLNTVFSTIESIIPLITDNRPITQVVPRFPFMQKVSEALNNVTKYAWQALEIPKKLHAWELDAMTCKYGVAKIWYDPGKRFGSKYCFEIIDPIDFFIAPGFEDPWEAPFCGIRTQKPISWVKRYFPDVKEIKAGKSNTNTEGTKRAFKFSDNSSIDDETEFVEITETWIRDDEALEEIVEEDENGKRKKTKRKKYPYGKYCWFTPHQELGTMPAEDNHGLPPYVILHTYIRPHDFTGISIVELIEGLHKDANLILKYYSDFIRIYHNQNELADISGGSFDVDEYKRSRSKGGQVYLWDSQGGSKQSPVSPIPEPQLHPNMREYIGIIPSFIEDVTGVTDITKGQVGKQERQSAVELGILHETSNTRIRQMIRNLESSLSRSYYLLLRLVMQHQTDIEYFPFKEPDGTGYQQYGNSFAQAQEIMRPQENERITGLMERQQKTGIPITNQNDLKAYERYKQELDDYEKFLTVFKDNGEFDPIFFDFDIEIQNDSMLPMDKQSRANILLRLLQMAPAEAKLPVFKLVLEYLQIPNAQDIIIEMDELAAAAKQKQMEPKTKGGSQIAQTNPQLYQQYQQEVGGQNG